MPVPLAAPAAHPHAGAVPSVSQVMDCRVWTEASAANTQAQHAPAAGTVTAVTRPGVFRSGVA